jgi:O-antigen ligase
VSGAALAGLALAATLQVVVAYRTTPLMALAAVLGVALVALVLWRPAAGVYVAILSIPLVVFDVRLGGAGGLSPPEAMLILTAALTASRFLSHGTPRIHAAHGLFAAFLVAIAVGLAVADDRAATLKILAMWIVFLAVSVLVASFGRREIERLLLCIAVTAGVLGAIALAGQGEQEILAGGTQVTGRATASFRHPNLLGFFLVMSIPPALALAARGRRSGQQALALACAGLGLVGLLLTLSRGAVLGLTAALLILLAWPRFRRLVIPALAVLAVAVALNAAQLWGAREVSVVQEHVNVVAERIASVTNPDVLRVNPRWRIWEAAPEILAGHPLIGVGAGNFAAASPRYGLVDVDGRAFDHAHSLLLTVTLETGLVGLALFAAFLLAVVRAGRSVLRHRGSSLYPLGLALCAALAGVFVIGLADYPPRANFIVATVMIEVGALIGLERLLDESGSGS